MNSGAFSRFYDVMIIVIIELCLHLPMHHIRVNVCIKIQQKIFSATLIWYPSHQGPDLQYILRFVLRLLQDQLKVCRKCDTCDIV